MGLQVAYLFADEDGETHFADLDLVAHIQPAESTVSLFVIPTTSMSYVEYPAGELEIMPGFHPTPSRHFITPLRGAFEVTTTTGERRVIRQGDWILFDDMDSKGHTTKGVGADRRINLLINIADEWKVPRS